MVLVSATAFGTNAIFAKLAYAAGLGTTQTLAFRFLLAAVGMWGLALAMRQNPLRFERKRLLALLGLGAIVYTAQSLSYFTALQTLAAFLLMLQESLALRKGDDPLNNDVRSLVRRFPRVTYAFAVLIGMLLGHLLWP